MPVRRDWGRRAIRALIRHRRPGKPVEGVVVTKVDHGPGLRLYTLVYAPVDYTLVDHTPVDAGPGAALLWIHGGGLVIGDVAQDEAFCALTARALGVVVASAEYRRTAGRRELDRPRHRVWNNSVNRVGWGAYLGAEPGGSQTPDYAAAARRTDPRGLPTIWNS